MGFINDVGKFFWFLLIIFLTLNLMAFYGAPPPPPPQAVHLYKSIARVHILACRFAALDTWVQVQCSSQTDRSLASTSYSFCRALCQARWPRLHHCVSLVSLLPHSPFTVARLWLGGGGAVGVWDGGEAGVAAAGRHHGRVRHPQPGGGLCAVWLLLR